MSNQAFIDGQNLHLGTTTSRPSWKIDLARFRSYLTRKYNVGKAYYFMGTIDNTQSEMYRHIQEAGYILIFRTHNPNMTSAKKGNVDTDIVFTIMKRLYKKELDGKVILVSGDGDYYKMVEFLIAENKLEKILFPDRKKASSLYRLLAPKYFDYLDNPDLKKKITYSKKTK